VIVGYRVKVKVEVDRVIDAELINFTTSPETTINEIATNFNGGHQQPASAVAARRPSTDMSRMKSLLRRQGIWNNGNLPINLIRLINFITRLTMIDVGDTTKTDADHRSRSQALLLIDVRARMNKIGWWRHSRNAEAASIYSYLYNNIILSI
jgi:hypothetical protein